MRIVEETRGEYDETCRRISVKARQFVVRAPVRLSVTQLDIAVVGGGLLGMAHGQGWAMRRANMTW
jgi:hypothetical protein